MAGSTRTRTPVKTGARRDIEEQIGKTSTSKEHPDLDPLPPNWKSRQEQVKDEDEEDEQRTRAMRTEYRRQARERTRAQNRPPTQPRARSPRSSRSAAPRARRTGRPSLGDPTGGRLPFLSFDGEGIAGVFFGAVFYALVLSVADYGTSGPKLWFKAKFLNQPAPAKGKG